MSLPKYPRILSCATVLISINLDYFMITRDLPKITLQQFSTHIILSLGARYVLIFNNSADHSVLVP